MNKHILLVMKWLNDNDSVTQEELEANKESADADDAYYADVAWADYGAWATWDASAERKVNHYFEITGEDKQTYIDELEQSQ